MAITVSSIYAEVCYDLLEDGGLTLGLVTDQEFIAFLNMVLVDFGTQAGINQKIFTVTVSTGVGSYSVPNDIIRVEDAFLAGVYLEQSDVQQLNNGLPGWRYLSGPPSDRWHADELLPQTIQVVLAPNYTGGFLRGSGYPSLPNGQYGDWYANVDTNPGSGPIVRESPPQHGDLTLVGPALPAAVASFNDTLPWADDLCLACLAFGVLERIFSGDNEVKDPQRALWAKSQYQEMVAILSAIMNEPDES